jgi:O-antigen/teichoic acid export membrane protein
MGFSAPHNYLISDAVLQNIHWKELARQSLSQGAFPLWNPNVLSGVPFQATGQPGSLYPLGILFFILPLFKAYGWFIALHLFLAGMFTYTYLRVIKVGWFGATFAGLAFMYAGVLIVHFLWPMVVSTLIWLPLVLTFIELILQEFEHTPRRNNRVLMWALLGVIAVGMQFLAGHAEFNFYVLFSALFYAVCRFITLFWSQRSLRAVIGAGVVLMAMMLVGLGLGAVQLLPFSEIGAANFRSGMVTYQDVIGWALPKPQILAFVMPDYFGNPSQHSFFDFLTQQMQSASHTYNGNIVATVHDWGRKNFVEGCAYIGILPLVGAVVAVLFRRNRYTWIFLAYAVWSLLLAFGSPLYRLFFFGIPGFDQMHTPFRWIFPYSMCVAMLAGIGMDWMAHQLQDKAQGTSRRVFKWLSIIGLVAGFGSLIALAVALIKPRRFIEFATRMYDGSEKLHESFGSGTAFFNFEFGNLLALAIFCTGSALVLWLAYRHIVLPKRFGSVPIWMPLAILLVVGDLWFFGWDFNARSDPEQMKFVPPSIQVLQQDPALFRVTSYGLEDILPPVTGMQFGLQDIRGYDTMIPKQYVEYWSLMENAQGLPYSKIHKLIEPASLSSQFLDLLNVKYVLTKANLSVPNMTEVYRGELNIYRNEDVMPRAFLVPQGKLVSDGVETLNIMRQASFDARKLALLENPTKTNRTTPEPQLANLVAETNAAANTRADKSSDSVQITSYQTNRVKIKVHSATPTFLLLADSYFPGWEVKLGDQTPTLFKADYNFRAVAVPAGDSEVTFEYDPPTFKLGQFASGIAALIVILGFFIVGVQRLRPRLEGAGTIGRVAKNSGTPMAASMMNKLVDIAFAMLTLRLLGAAGTGKYTFAVVVITYFEILTNFGLNTLLTREVAKDHSSGNNYLSNTAILRMILLVASTPLIAAVIFLYHKFTGLEVDTAITIVLLAIALVPGNISSALSSAFYAFEKMEFPAVITIVSTLLKVIIGTVLLLLGYGIIGLAGTAVIVNFITMGIFIYLVYTKLFRPQLEFDPSMSRGILKTSFPLMINIFLSTVFFRADVLFLKAMRDDSTVGYYSTAYKFIDGLTIIPTTFTLAIFPILSRFAESAQDSLLRAYTMSLRILIMISFPIVVGTVVLAQPIILFFGGEQYVPNSVIALQVLIFFLPFSYINSVTQYVLIAVNQQRFLTYGFIIGASFNILANLVMITLFGYVGAALVTIFSEIILLIPFMYGVRRYIGSVPLLSLMLKPAIASAVMGLVIWQLQMLNPFLIAAIGIVIYALVMLALRAFTEDDRYVVRELLARGTN